MCKDTAKVKLLKAKRQKNLESSKGNNTSLKMNGGEGIPMTDFSPEIMECMNARIHTTFQEMKKKSIFYPKFYFQQKYPSVMNREVKTLVIVR